MKLLLLLLIGSIILSGCANIDSENEVFTRHAIQDLELAKDYVEMGDYNSARLVYDKINLIYWFLYNNKFSNMKDEFWEEYYLEVSLAENGEYQAVDTLKHQHFLYLYSDLPQIKEWLEDYCSGKSEVSVAGYDCDNLENLRLWAMEEDS